MSDHPTDRSGGLGILIRHLESGVLTILFLGLLGVGLIQLGARWLSDNELPWAAPMMQALVLWLMMVGGVVASGRLRHIRIGLVEQLVPGVALLWLQRLTCLTTALICLALTWTSLRTVALEYEFQVMAFLAVPTWLVQVIVPIGFGIMAARFLAWSVRPPGVSPNTIESQSGLS